MSSKKETNSFIFEGEKNKYDFFDEDNEDDKLEMKKLQNILSDSQNKIEEEEDDNKDLNNITSVSETDKVYVGEVKDGSKKSQESEFEIEDELNETSLTNKNCDEEPKDLDDINNNINNINNNIKNNNEAIKKSVESIKNNKNNINNINIHEQLLNEIKQEDDYLIKNQKKENSTNKQKNRNKIKNNNQIFLIKKIKIRSKKIQLLRKKKGLHLIRKKDSDTIRKKIKTYFHNYLLDLLNLKLKILDAEEGIIDYEQIISKRKTSHNNNYKKVKKFLKFNNKFTTNVSIIINRNLLKKKLSDILISEPISSKYKAYDLKNNYYLTNYLLSLKQYSEIQLILNMKYMELYHEFIKSVTFKNILKKVKNRDGEEYLNKFKNISENYISYFEDSKSKKIPKEVYKKKIYKKDKNQNSLDSEKGILNINNDNNLKSVKNNLYSEYKNFKFKGINDFPSISFENNDISLIEDYQDFFDNSLNHNYFIEKSFIELHSKLINQKDEKNNKLFESLISLDDEKNNIFYKGKQDCFFTENEIKLSFDSNNLSDIKEENDYKKYMNDDFQSIMKKPTYDSSKTNETDIVPKFDTNYYKDHFLSIESIIK